MNVPMHLCYAGTTSHRSAQRRLQEYVEAANNLSSQSSAQVKRCHGKLRDARIKVRRKYWQVTGTLRQVPGQSSYLQGRIGMERSRSDIITPKGVCRAHAEKVSSPEIAYCTGTSTAQHGGRAPEASRCKRRQRKALLLG